MAQNTPFDSINSLDSADWLSLLGAGLGFGLGGIGPGLFGISAFLNNRRAQELNDLSEDRRQESLDYIDEILSPEEIDQVLSGGTGSYNLFRGKNVSGGPYEGGPINQIFDPFSSEDELRYDPTAINQVISQTGRRQDNALDESRTRFDDQLTSTRGLYDRGRADIGGLYGAEKDRLLGSKLGLGSTFGLLDLPDADEVYNASLSAGNRAALQAEQSSLDQLGSEMFRESARLGKDPFDSGIPTQVRESARNRRLSDLGGARLGAENQRLSALASNASTRQSALASEISQNSAIDSAIAQLTAATEGEFGDLTSEQAGEERAVQSALEDALSRTRGIYEPQLTSLVGTRENGESASLDRLLNRDVASGDYLNNYLNRESNNRNAQMAFAQAMAQLRASIAAGLPPANVDWANLLASYKNLYDEDEVDRGGSFLGIGG